jgi:hypothetical protein
VVGEDAWTLSVQREFKLLEGMKAGEKEPGSLYGIGAYAESPYDGDLYDTILSWGYNDNTEAMQKIADKECNMDSATGHMLKKTFDELGMTTKPKSQGGPNECFQIEHYDSPAMILKEDGTRPDKHNQYYKAPCDAEFRVTGTEHTVGVNAQSGAVFALDIKSPAKAARNLWRRAATTEELPHIRSFSDISWAFWNRPAAGNIQHLKYFFVAMIVNTETDRHIRQALQTLTPAKEDAEGWPGAEFSMVTDAGKALLGSPVGRWAGYFLMQHKRQLGGNKFISKVRVFKSEKAGSLPYFLFYVEGPASSTGSALENRDNEGPKIVPEQRVTRSVDGRSIVREHVFRAKL